VNPEEYGRMFEHEDRYWWFVARRRLALRLLQNYSNSKEKPTVLDLGCGTCALVSELAASASAVGADMSRMALNYGRTRGGFGLVQADGTALPFQSGTFDAILGLDVFEHIEDDAAAFAQCARALKPGGLLVLSVPAFKNLWGPHDIALHHFRRYRRLQVIECLRAANLEPVKVSYSVFFLFPLVVVSRLFQKTKRGPAAVSLPSVPKWLNTLLIKLGEVEASLISKIRLPWGSSIVAVARKSK
jgi:SAM-dependent methyltransferase